MKLLFHSKDTYYKEPFGAVAVDTAIAFRAEIQWEEGEAFDSNGLRVELLIWEDGEDPAWFSGKRKEQGNQEEQGDRQCKLTYSWSFSPQKPGLFFYRFQAYCNNQPVAESDEGQLTVYKKEYETPEWLSKGLMYQIFPDRFARSSHYEAPPQKKRHILHEAWGEKPLKGPDEQGIVWNDDFFGGNLKGIEEQLPYLAALGVTVIYLNPIFRAFSNHRYDTADYLQIDPMLGTEADFVSLCKEAKKQGIRIILDGVFNHTGSHSIYFNKDGAFPGQGAYQSMDSPYYRWYSFSSYPNEYASWWGIDTLPAVNEMEESYRDFILRGENSVVKHWLRLGASGFRLDVADELPDAFIEELRIAVKSVVPDGAVIGEVWEDASNKIAYGQRKRYFQGDQLDTVMNYPLKEGLIAFLTEHRDGELLQNQIMELMEHYPQVSFRCLMNILGTHDTPRILTALAGGNHEWNPQWERGRQLLFMALLVWAFVPGIPCIYYGDELGMEGGADPENRCCFSLAKVKKEISTFYRRLLHFRKSIQRLSHMNYVPGQSEKGCFSFERRGEGQRIFVYLNAWEKNHTLTLPLTPGERLLDFVNCGQLIIEEKQFVLGPESGIVMHIEETACI